MFAVDSFGAILPRASQDVENFSEDELVAAMLAWATFDSPWAHLTDRTRFGQVLDEVRGLGAERILSSHLPPTTGRVDQLLQVVESVRDAEPFLAPDAAAFNEIAAAMASGGGRPS